MNEGFCDMCGHHVVLRQRAHIVAEGDRSAENILMLCPSCHVLFDHYLKPKLYRALKKANLPDLPVSWATSHYEQAAAASRKALLEKGLKRQNDEGKQGSSPQRRRVGSDDPGAWDE